MRSALALVVLLVLFAAPALAANGNVPRGVLSSLGLGDMKTMSDAEGMQVRGLATSSVRYWGTSVVSGQLMTPDTLNFVVFSSVNSVDANGQSSNVGALMLTGSHSAAISPAMTLNVTFPDTTTYSGSMVGTITGTGSVTVTLP